MGPSRHCRARSVLELDVGRGPRQAASSCQARGCTPRSPRRSPRPLEPGAGSRAADRHSTGAAERRGRGEASSRQADGVRTLRCPGLLTAGAHKTCPSSLMNGPPETATSIRAAVAPTRHAILRKADTDRSTNYEQPRHTRPIFIRRMLRSSFVQPSSCIMHHASCQARRAVR